ncbi:hypothetical protein BFJ66_g1062 [Fusarium oxysporum f. sp. cepae]|uniref:Zn(2)-C6 fungal-type domain-containing protein n=1 Tax=Fusarium oxysporum f. sp. cepae TaxID=396571 RepID=A0A3L6NM67_FUSOX|nr:hypothetical protein BFJ65_g9207 [Fusarium oxysporum f. sp. cepae]RKK34497.1 hypothetical protein BFJ67_g13775 [Fusarium oxysporum f. sp. cepae]RKK62257.1 hypothetical protein BFJ66_g1062 [Fusarium oxysporum f. sp. cepae]
MGRRKVSKACSTCRRRKVKCDDGRPCIPCKTKYWQCDDLVGQSIELVHTDRRTPAREACSTCQQRKVKCDDGRPCIPCKTRYLQCDDLVGRFTELVHTDRRTSADTANSYTYFFYRIRQRNSSRQGFGYVLGDGNLIVEPFEVLPVLRKAIRVFKKDQHQICHQNLTIESRQSAELSVLHDGQVRVTAEFFGEAPGQEVRVSLWKIADGTTRKLGPATHIGSTRWYIVTNYNNLIGHAVIFTRRQAEEVISVPVPPGPNKSPFHESTSSSVPVDSAVGSPQAELEPTAWMYTYGVGTSARTDILIKYNSVCYTYQTYDYLKSRLLALVEQQAEQARHLTELSITPYQIHYCTEKYIQNQLHLEANFSKDVSDRSVSIKVYSPGRKDWPIHAQQHKQASQCSVFIDLVEYHGNIIVFNCDDEYIASFPVKRPWLPHCDIELHRMKTMQMADSDIYNSFSSYARNSITEELEWYSRPLDRLGVKKRREVVSGLVRSGREVHWRKERQNLGEAFRGMQFKSFQNMWRAECSGHVRYPALHFN